MCNNNARTFSCCSYVKIGKGYLTMRTLIRRIRVLINFGKNNPTERRWEVIDGRKQVEKWELQREGARENEMN